MSDNPYAPPSASAQAPPTGLIFSPEGVAVVAKLARAMRALSTFYYVFVAILVLFGGYTLLMTMSISGALGVGLAVGLLIGGALLIAIAVWLRNAAEGFERGVAADDEFSLGQGFRALRAYLILFGVLGILSLLNSISDTMEAL